MTREYTRPLACTSERDRIAAENGVLIVCDFFDDVTGEGDGERFEWTCPQCGIEQNVKDLPAEVDPDGDR